MHSLCTSDIRLPVNLPRWDALCGIVRWNRASARSRIAPRRAIAMTLSLRRGHSQFLRSAIRCSPINAFAPLNKSDGPPPPPSAQHLMNQIRCGASGIVWSIITTRIWNLARDTTMPDSICESLMAGRVRLVEVLRNWSCVRYTLK